MNLKRIILGSALAVATAMSLSLNISAAPAGLREDFNFGTGEIGTPGGKNEHNIYITDITASDFAEVKLDKDLDYEYLSLSVKPNKEVDNSVKVSIRDNGGVSNIINQPGKSVVVNTRIKTERGFSKKIGFYFSKEFANDPSINATYQFNIRSITPKVWHDVKFVLYNGGGLTADGSSQDAIYAYVDGELLEKQQFNKNHDFDGRCSEIFFQIDKSKFGYSEQLLVDYLDVYAYDQANDASASLVLEEIKSSFKIQYTEGDESNANVDFRIGGLIKNESYDPMAEYGIIILDNKDAAKLDNLTPAGLAELKTQKLAHAIKPVKVDLGYQFAWVIPNIEGHYDFEFRPAFYMLKDGVLTLSKHDNIVSAADTARKYLNDEAIKANKSLAAIMNMISAKKQVEE